uniref:hypothetical protein n=1 Tax=Porodaedalea mongolica TaxID=2651638 RepID=UPI0021ABF3B4|nr:hypothetical protein NYK79_mgp49 [Porodaedalea mongolica]UUA03941.1 hypothetical protein [Porodaedalea mongolica]WCF76701.1 ribosomal protein S3 [Porodaedalea mongolica]
MNTNNKNTLSNNPKSITTNFNSVIYSSDINNKARFVSYITGFRGGNAKNLFTKIENLKLQPSDQVYPSLTTDVFANYIKGKKLTKLEFKNNVESNLFEDILIFSDLLTGKVLKPSGSGAKDFNAMAPVITDGDSQISEEVKHQFKYAPSPKGERSGLFMSLNSFKDYFNYLSNAISTFTLAEGKGKLNYPTPLIKDNNKINSYKIRHYLNLLTKFDFKLSTSNYDYFQFKKSNKYLFAMEKAADLLRLAFLTKGCLISKPIFNIVYSHNGLENEFNLSESKDTNSNKAKIIIHLFYYIKTKGLLNKASPSGKLSSTFKGTSYRGQGKDKFLTSIYDAKFLFLSDYLTKLFNTEIEFELVRLYQPYQDSNILVQFLNNQSYNKKFIKLVSRLFRKINIYKKNKFNIPNTTLLNEAVSFPSGVSGVNIKLAGRPINERIIPRLTVKRAQRGNFNRLNAKVIEKSMFTDKSRKGAFNFTVRLSHIFR